MSLIREDVWNRISKESPGGPRLQEWKGKRLVGVNGSPLSVRGFGKFQVFLEGWKAPLDVLLIVTSDLTVHEAILGLDFVEEHKCLIDCSRKLLAFPRDGPSVQIQCRPSSHTAAALGETVGLLTAEKIVVPPGSEMELMVKQTSEATGGTWFVESDVSSRLGVIVARGLVCPNRNGLVPVRVLNPRDEEVVLIKGVHLAKMELIDDDCTVNVSAISKKSNLSQEDQSTLWKMVCESGNYSGNRDTCR